MSVRVTDHNLSYQAFRDFVVYTCAQLLMRKKRLPIQHVDEDASAQEGIAGQEESEPDLSTYEGLLAAVRRMAGGKGTGKKKRKGTGKGQKLQVVDAGYAAPIAVVSTASPTAKSSLWTVPNVHAGSATRAGI